MVGWPGGRVVGWVGGWVAGKAEIITNSAQLGLGLGLSLAKIGKIIHLVCANALFSSGISCFLFGSVLK